MTQTLNDSLDVETFSNVYNALVDHELYQEYLLRLWSQLSRLQGWKESAEKTIADLHQMISEQDQRILCLLADDGPIDNPIPDNQMHPVGFYVETHDDDDC